MSYLALLKEAEERGRDQKQTVTLYEENEVNAETVAASAQKTETGGQENHEVDRVLMAWWDILKIRLDRDRVLKHLRDLRAWRQSGQARHPIGNP